MLNILKGWVNDPSVIKYVKNTSWLFGERVFKLVVGFLILVLLTRHLGPEGFGILSYAQSYIGIFAAFATLGLEVLLVKEMAKGESDTDTVLGTALAMKLIASMLAILIAVTINSNIEDGEVRQLTNIISITILFQSFSLGIDTYFQANVLSRISAIANILTFVVSSMVKLTLIFFDAELIYFAYALVFDSIIIFISYVYIFFGLSNGYGKPKFNKEMAVFFLKKGWPTMMVAMAAFIYTRIDQVMIQYLMDSKSVGVYAAAIRVSELFYFIPLLIAQSVFPKIIHQKEVGDTKRYFALLERLYRLVFWVAVPIVALIVYFSDLIVASLYGTAFMESAKILSVLAFCLFFVAIGSVGTKILYAEGFERKYLSRSISGVFINIVLNYIFIKSHGAVGAAVSTLLTLIGIHYVYDLFDKELRKFYYLKWRCFLPKL